VTRTNVTFGSVSGGLASFAGVYAAALAALAEAPYRVLLTTGAGLDPDALGSVPDHVRVEPWWPQADLMPATAAVVGHGGFGTTMTAALHGVPQVVVPLFSFDQRLNAQHVAAAGAGVHLDGGIDALDSLPQVLHGLLSSPAHRERAAVIADAAGSLPPVNHAVGLLESLARP
jgi:UDP:flavonoid glycosyltransferase YjiC (YdhE family)